MANLSKTRTIFGFTSPRTIEKIIPEIKLLIDNFSGQEWAGNQSLQSDFFNVLFNSVYYDGDKYPSDPAFASRDRITRAPKALGFIDLKPNIQLTKAGKILLEGKRLEETFTKQLLKFQLPSPYHKNFPEDFFVKPYLELIRLIFELGSISKTEISIFFTQLTHIRKFDLIVQKIRTFRDKAKKYKGSRKMYVSQIFQEEIKEIYAEEINKNNIRTRESEDVSLKNFIETKASNMRDYADAFIRYIRSTQLVTFEKRTYRLIILQTRIEDVKFLLTKIEREPLKFKTEKEFKRYLFDPDTIQLLTDNEELLLKKLRKFNIIVNKGDLTINQLKDLREKTENKIKERNIVKKTTELKLYKEYKDIVEVFSKIKKREVPDSSLFLEWNVWRSFVMLNYAIRIDGNFIMDIDGMPLNTAPGKQADIETEYNGFGMIVEVTMSMGDTQYRTENESVPRHFGKTKESLRKDLYCIFIAPSISSGTLAHYFNLNKMNTRLYGGKTKIIPLTIDQFLKFIEIGVSQKFKEPKKLQNWLKYLWQFSQGCKDENSWSEFIASRIKNWV